MSEKDPLAGTNLAYAEELYARFLADPDSVDEDWRRYFESSQRDANGDGLDAAAARRAADGPSFRPASIFNPPVAAGAVVVPIRESELPPLARDDLAERLKFLRGAQIFQDVPERDLAIAARLTEERRFEDGSLLFHEGDPVDSLYLLMEGTLVIRRRDGLVVTLRPGDVVGELGVFSALPRIADAAARGEVRVLRLKRDDLLALIDRRPALARGFLRVLSSRLRSDSTRQDKVNQLIHNFRVRGHLLAHLDPLGPPKLKSYPELDPEHYGFGEQDLDALFSSTMIPGTTVMSLGQILERMRATYCRSIGVQFMHIDALKAKEWLQARLEDPRHHRRLTRDEQLRILTKLTDAELFEEFIHRKFLGAKRFSLEGAETLIPLLDLTLEEAGCQGVREVVFGMAHRGRLNVLVNVMGKSASEVFREFADEDAEEFIGRGDVKYHLGYSSDRSFHGQEMHLSLCFNPSHLEFVGPVLAGRVRAKQDRYGDAEHRRCLGVVIHGDAAFAGQGVVQELFNLSDLSGYRVGGTVHVIVNNQIGFTTPPEAGRSTRYATDVARMLQTPIFHVNGEDPEAVAHVVSVAMDYRHEFRNDVVIDMYCYRRHGHNEGDEPSFTQPLLYDKIRERKPVREGYLEHLLKLDGVTREEADQIARQRKKNLEGELSRARDPGYKLRGPASGEGLWKPYRGGSDAETPEVATGVDKAKLAELLRATTRVPGSFHVHKKLKGFMDVRLEMADGEKPLDWAAAEALALASLLVEGAPVRFSGQDSGRGTFSHRHTVFHDVETGETYTPLAHLTPDQARFQILDSPLSEIAVLGFDYGYSLDTPEGLTVWEAQFGDFCNVAQVIIDQFITSGEDKWRRLSGLVMLLPHAFEGQGPEHSSARLERFLDLAAEDNIQVVNLTTPAQLFHCLRRQVVRPWRKPLVVMSPKSLLRHNAVVSSLDELAEGAFRRVLPDAGDADPGSVAKVILTSGKVYYDLEAARRERERHDVAILRLEQYYPIDAAVLLGALGAYPHDTPLVWVQEEPVNMGAWGFMRLHVEPLLDGRWPLSCVTRPVSASPATGSAAAHKQEQALLIDEALT
jgi:2-oxoglutarate dehydrogenase E1 component